MQIVSVFLGTFLVKKYLFFTTFGIYTGRLKNRFLVIAVIKDDCLTQLLSLSTIKMEDVVENDDY